MDYKTLKEHKDYANLVKSTAILGTWDDHDYGLNDGGEDYEMRIESQQLFLDFLMCLKKTQDERAKVFTTPNCLKQ